MKVPLLHFVKRLPRFITQRIFPNLSYQLRLRWWNKVWERQADLQNLEISIPDQLSVSVKNGWIAPGCKVADIGCGSGELTAWLAKNGFDAVGMDYSSEAIRIASKWLDRIDGKLSYVVGDICKHIVSGGPYDIMIDKGCLHGIAGGYQAIAVENIARSCKHGGKLLMLYRLTRDKEQEKERLETLFLPFFIFEKVENTVMRRVAGNLSNIDLPCLAIWMVRNDQ